MKRSVVVLILIITMFAVSADVYPQAKKAEKATDPVCGLSVDKDPALSVTYKGQTYYFCLSKDMDTFKANPEKYAKK
jgi:YHS domain-containing protein